MTRIVERDPDSTGTEVDGETFLVKTGEEDIHHLDIIASGLWRFLEKPHDTNELEAVFEAAFPEVPLEKLRGDLNHALDELISAGYLRFQGPNTSIADAAQD